MVGIYKITSPSNKVYIGQSRNISKRKSSYKKNPNKSQRYIYSSLCKYGFENHKFEVIHELPNDVSQSILDNYECFYIELYSNSNIILMNIRKGGAKGKVSEETLEKMRKTTHGREFLIEYNKRKDRYKRPKGFWKNKRHPREYKLIQYDVDMNIIKNWDSISEINKQLNYNKQNISKVVRNNSKYKNSYWKRIQ